MTADSNDPIRAGNGSVTQVQRWHDLLRGAGIESRVVRDDLTAGLGVALPDSAELWVQRADAGAAEAVIAGVSGHGHRDPESYPPATRPPRVRRQTRPLPRPPTRCPAPPPAPFMMSPIKQGLNGSRP
jgi:hypothetical protein